MKKYILILMTGLLAAVSCSLEDVYQRTNVDDILMYYEGKLCNDYGTVYTVTGNEAAGNWKQEGKRFYTVFDILNRNFDITIKELHEFENITSTPTEEEKPELGDPVQLIVGTVSGGFVNILFRTYSDKKSDYEQKVSFLHKFNGSELQLFMVFDGNHENPAEKDVENLESKEHYVCIPIFHHDVKITSLSFKVNELKQTGASEFTAEETVYPFTFSVN